MAFFKRFQNQNIDPEKAAVLAEELPEVKNAVRSEEKESPAPEPYLGGANAYRPYAPGETPAQPEQQRRRGRMFGSHTKSGLPTAGMPVSEPPASPQQPQQQAPAAEQTPPAGKPTQRKRGKRFKKSALDPVLSFGVDEMPEVQPVRQTEQRAREMRSEIDTLGEIFGTNVPETLPPLESNPAAGAEPQLPERRLSGSEHEVPEAGAAPIVQPMESARKTVRERKERRAEERERTGASLAFADLSDRESLSAEEIENASDIYGIKYPACFDPSACDFDGRAIDFSNFSLVSALRWEDIAGATDISGVVFPASFDIDHAELFGRSLRSCDFSALYALKWRHIEAAEDIIGVKYPPTFDIADACFTGRNIAGSDFSLVTAMRFSHIAEAADISGIKYPAEFDIDNADFSSRDISRSDFSLVKGLCWEHIASASSIKGIVYPRGFDLSACDFSSRDISGSDFTRLESFSFDAIRNASGIRSVKYPDCFSADDSDYTGRDIYGSNFSRVATLRFKHIVKADNIKKLVYPPQFDIDNADFSDREIDFSDFSLLPGFNWEAAMFAESRDGVVYPAGFVEPVPSDDDVQGAMLIFLLKLYTKEFKGETPTDRFYEDVAALYPGVESEKAARLIENATKRWEAENGKRRVELTARSAHIGDKLYMLKLGFKLLYPAHGNEETLNILREGLGRIFKRREKERFEGRLEDLSRGKYLSAAELSAISFVPKTEHKEAKEVAFAAEKPVTTAPEAKPESAPEERSEKTADKPREKAQSKPPEVERPKVYTFGSMPVRDIPIDDTPFELPDAELLNDTSDEGAEQTQPAPEVKPAPEEKPAPVPVPQAKPEPEGDEIGKPLDLDKLRSKQLEAEKKSKALSDEEKGIRTGVMGMLLYIHKSVSDEEISNGELFSEFMRIYPGAAAKEVAAMAQFASNTLNGRNADTRSKLFLFASRAPEAIKHKLLDFAYSIYIYRLSETADEEVFREFLRALCNTLFEDSPEYEYSNFLRRKDILKSPLPDREACYKRIPFDSGVGKANLYANERYPFYRTLEQLRFSHFTFEAIKGSLLIEVSDSRAYEELSRLVFREKEPNLLQFVVIETSLGYLYLERRCLADWDVTEETVWRTAERNMLKQKMLPRYSFSSSEYTSFRYIQHDLASYVITSPRLLESLAKGRDLILSTPCREIVYIDVYNFSAVKKLLEFSAHYNCTLTINGEEYEHPISPDVFIYHADDQTIERVNDESYILLGDSVARREVLHSVLPLNVEVNAKALVAPGQTDRVEPMTDEAVTIQEAAFTLLRVYSEMNGDRDYTLPYNAMMGIFDELYISSDALYPPARGREQPDPMEHIDTAARLVTKAGKTVCWLLVQGMQHLCGDVKYETPTSAGVRQTVLDEIYGENANAVWLNCATASEFDRKFEATRSLHEVMVENQHLTILDSRMEVLMHALTLMFHQFGRKYALGQVRKHMLRAIPDIVFNFEINQSAWLPAPGDDVDVELQSLGMLLRGFDRVTQERILASCAAAIGDSDLTEGGWPLLVFIKLVKYAYMDPAEMVERYFVSRSRLIPSGTVLKQLYYKDLNNEFIKHSRKLTRVTAVPEEDAFEELPATAQGAGEYAGSFESVLSFDSRPLEQLGEDGMLRPELQFRPVEPGYLEKRMSFVLEELNPTVVRQLKEAAHFVTKVFHAPEMLFKSNDDLECELHYGILRRKVQITTLRSMAWTLYQLLLESGRDMRDVTESDILRAQEIVEVNNRLNYRQGGAFPTLCAMNLDEGMFIPAYEQIIYFAQELMPETKLQSLFSLQEELTELAPSMKLIYDILKGQKRGELMPPQGILFDVICAWSALCFASGEAFELTDGPSVYNYNQIAR